mgnify:CR=1 FL=1
MKFILFFYLLSLAVITGAVVAGDEITGSDTYSQYLKNSAVELQQEPIQHDKLPSEVRKSFSESAFGDKIISQAYIIPTSTASSLIDYFVKDDASTEQMYLLTLSAEQDEMNTVLKFTSKGELVNVLN